MKYTLENINTQRVRDIVNVKQVNKGLIACRINLKAPGAFICAREPLFVPSRIHGEAKMRRNSEIAKPAVIG